MSNYIYSGNSPQMLTIVQLFSQLLLTSPLLSGRVPRLWAQLTYEPILCYSISHWNQYDIHTFDNNIYYSQDILIYCIVPFLFRVFVFLCVKA